MITLNKMRFEILEVINEYTDDSTIDYRLLDHLIEEYRVKWFEMTYNKFNKFIPQAYYQTIECLEVELKDMAECCDIEVETGCKILRTVREVPGFISLTDGELISKVSPVGIKNIPFKVIRYENLEYYGHSRYNAQNIAAFYYNNRIYLYSRENIMAYPVIEKITLRGIFRYPSEVGKYTNCSNHPCWSPDSYYPIDERLWNYAKSDLLQREFNIKLSVIEDLSNDNRARTITVQTPPAQSQE